MKRRRFYHLTAPHPTGPTFASGTASYSPGRWLIEVVAVSIQQAHYLAGHSVMAQGPGDIGVRRIKNAHAETRLAPYLQKGG